MTTTTTTTSQFHFDYTKSQLQHWDFVIIAVYLITVLLVGVWSTAKSYLLKCCRNSPTPESQQPDGLPPVDNPLGQYFLASRNMHWIPVGASLFASNIGSEHFIGLAGSAAASGIAIATFELNAIFILMLLGWLFAPVYHSAGVYTMPEYLVLRFGRQRIRTFLSCLALLFYIFTKISADLYAGALFIKYAMGFAGDSGLYLSIAVLLIIAAIFCITGGLSAVIWTDFVQTILMVIGALVVMFMALDQVGGYEALLDQYEQANADPEFIAYEWDEIRQVNRTCGAVRPDFMHLFHSSDDSFLPWTGVMSGMLIASTYYWCTDQVIVQRLLAARNLSHAKAGTILAGYLKLLPMFMLVLPGMAARVLFRNQVGCSDPAHCKEICGSEQGCSNVAYVFLVLKLMPHGLRGLMMAVMLAALMSSLTSIFNSSSTIFTIDVWTMIRTNASKMELVLVGRFFVLLLVLVSIAWIPLITSFSNSQLFVYIQAISNFLTPQITATFILAIFWSRITEPVESFYPPKFYKEGLSRYKGAPFQGAFWGLMCGFVCGLIRFALEFIYTAPPCGSGRPDERPEFIKTAVHGFHYLHFGVFLFFFTIVVSVVISLLTKPIDQDRLHRLTFWSRHSTEPRRKWLWEMKTRQQPTSSQSATQETVMKLVSTICFVSSKDLPPSGTEVGDEKHEEEVEMDQIRNFYNEKPRWKWLCAVSAVILMSGASFVFGFYA